MLARMQLILTCLAVPAAVQTSPLYSDIILRGSKTQGDAFPSREAATLAEAIHTVTSTAAPWPALAPGEAVTDTAPNFGVQDSHSQI